LFNYRLLVIDMIITIGAEKGGVGKSTLAFNLAAFFANQAVPDPVTKKKRPAKVILVDTDTTHTSAQWQAMRSHMQLQETFTVVEATVQPAPTIIQLSTQYDAVIVDVGARDYDRLAELARISDLWISPTKVGQGDLASTLRMAQAFATINDKHKSGRIPLCILVNAVPNVWNSSEGQDAIDALTQAVPTGVVLKTTLKDRRVWRDAHKAGKSIFEMPASARDKAEAEFVEAIQEALGAYAG